MSRKLRTAAKPAVAPRAWAIECLEERVALSVGVYTHKNDLANTGQNLQETVLTPGNVHAQTFGKLFSTPVDGQVYAQPLYVPDVQITVGPAQGIHDVVYVATQHDSVYAIDAASGSVLWHRSFIDPANGVTTVLTTDNLGSEDITPEVGITGTPVIDPDTQTIYVCARTKEIRADGTHFVTRLHALDLGSGDFKLAGTVTIADTRVNGPFYTYVSGPFVYGTGDGSVNGKITLNALRGNQRAALTLAHGSVYVAFASHGDNGPYHGWVVGYDARTFDATAVFNTTPNGGLGGIWHSGAKIAVDDEGYLHLQTGNGTFDDELDANGFPRNGNYGNAFIKLGLDPATGPNHPHINGWGLKVVDYFVPFNTEYLSSLDIDLGSTGVVVLPPSAGNADHPKLIIGSGKEGRIYLLDADDMGQFRPDYDDVVQSQLGSINAAFGAPAYFNGSVYFAAGYFDEAKEFAVSGAAFSPTAVSRSTDFYSWPGASPSISANGLEDAILWTIERSTNQLRAYDAYDLSRQLYHSEQAADGRDRLGAAVKFTVPTVADGRVFVGTANELVGYGLLSNAPYLPANPSGLVATTVGQGTVLLEWVDNAANEDEYRVEISTNGRDYSLLATLAADATRYLAAGLASESVFLFRIRAANEEGESGASPAAGAATPPAIGPGPVGPPAAPAFLAAASEGDRAVRLSWSSSDQAAGYLIERRTVSGEFSLVAATGAGVAQFLDSGLSSGTTYTYRVRGVNAAGASAPSPEASAATLFPPTTPTNARVVDVGEHYISMVWQDNSNNEDYFRILRRSGSAGNYETIALLPANTISYTDTGLASGSLYNYHIQAVNAAGWFDFTGVTATTTPDAPKGLVATAGIHQVTLRWNAVVGAETYTVYRSADWGGDPTIPVGTGLSSAFFVDQTARGGTTYLYEVVAVNDGGLSERSDEVLVTPLKPVPSPTEFRAVGIGPTSVTLAWRDNAADEAGYFVLRSSASQGVVLAAILGPNANGFVDQDLVPAAHYDYLLIAFGVNGVSTPAWLQLDTTLPAPEGLAAVGGIGQVALSWSPSPGADGYHIYRSAVPGGPRERIASGWKGSSYIDTSVAAGTPHFYQVTAVVGTVESLYSAEVAATALLALEAPTELRVLFIGADALYLAWTDNSSSESGFEVLSRAAGGNWTLAAATGANATGVLVGGLAPATAHDVLVNAVGPNARSLPAWGRFFTRPLPPQNLAAIANAASVALVWSPPGGNISVNIYRALSPLGDGLTQIASSLAASSYVDADVEAGTTYYYSATAVVENLESGFAPPIAATVPTALAAPVDLATAYLAPDQVDLVWRDVADGEWGYIVLRSLADGEEFTAVGDLPANAGRFEDFTVTPRTSYRYRVFAYGPGVFSDFAEIVATTLG